MLEKLSQQITDEFGLKIKIAGEIEFYVYPEFTYEDEDNDFLAKILFNLMVAHIKPWQMSREVAPGQFEVALQPTPAAQSAEEIEKLKTIIIETAALYERKVSFSAKPYEDLPGCGLHIHIGVDDLNGESVFEREGKRGNKPEETAVMKNIVAGLCSTMLKNFIYFAPNELSYLRFTSARNKSPAIDGNPLQAYNNAPVNVSWGGNNRTTAIRIPESSYDESTRHIEHRVAGADANPADVIEKILEGIYAGLKDNLQPFPKTYGNAFDKQYNYLQAFPKTLEEAKKLAE